MISVFLPDQRVALYPVGSKWDLFVDQDGVLRIFDFAMREVDPGS